MRENRLRKKEETGEIRIGIRETEKMREIRLKGKEDREIGKRNREENLFHALVLIGFPEDRFPRLCSDTMSEISEVLTCKC
jgi:hypothetical protein